MCPFACVLLLGLGTTAKAADGWYIRAALGVEQSSDADFSDRNCASQQPAALFGCVKGDDGRPLGAYGDFGRSPLIEVALGKRLLSWLRTDLSLSYRFDSAYDGNANFLSVGTHEPVSADLKSWSGMVNAFVDLAPLIKADLGRFQPYVGAGAGIAYNELSEMTYRFPQNPYRHKLSVTPGGERTSFAYRFMAGTGIRLTDSLILDLSIAYSDLGKVGTDAGVMVMNHVPMGIPIDETETHLRTLGIHLGLRYAF
ncbi:MAG: outer membrane beta-barrel protein [Lamprobacter sp.]|uniref:outer membrane protein n=1 Tax=Lamprobacter sp. TaxID=3100796 RepID=UPI002B25FE63|nr:outer membrane beta-barrel protein [Lamprobacter sp.]MEA3638820.1 outer membrane beta-barrel protein [Lamprobacter sp.]